ncbi:MAG: hypothetical protein R2793_09270 [Flavobacteriaceae bacterium]
MKSIFLILLFLATETLSTGCHKKSDDANNETNLNGTWHLKHLSGGFVGIDIEYQRGEVVWTFNESTLKVTVENNIDPADLNYPFSGLPTGSYDYEITVSDGTQYLSIEGAEQGALTVSSTSLVLDDRPADGFLRTFER